MESTKMYGLLTASFLLLTLLGDPTAACSCAPRHPQSAYCGADVVFKGKFVGVSKQPINISIGEPMWWVSYEVKTTKLYKGPEDMSDIRFLKTPAMESVCGYEHKAPLKGEDYVIAGMLEDDSVIITSCSFIQPWSQLSLAQRQGLSQTYGKGCNCMVLPCTSMPCTVTANSQCLWTDGIISGIWDGHQAKRLACLPRSNTNHTNLCTWAPFSTQGRSARRQ